MSQATTLPSPPNIEARDQARAALTEAQTTRESNTKAQAALDSSVDAELDADNMVRIPGGSFTMGSTSTETSRAGVPDQFAASERPPHAVVIRSFALAKYDVTFDDWDACVNDGGCDGYRPDDHGWGRGKRPVINVSWADAQSYITWFSAKRGHSFRLPTEAEWEYAARAGTTTAYYWGDAIGDNNANCGHCGSAWDGKKTAPVGSFAANPWGLYDMSGNVWQWTFDCWHDNYSGAPNDGSSWTTTYGISSLGMTSAIPGCTAQSVIRGGAWNGDPRYLRSATRHWGKAGERHFNLSFRLALTLP
jgi:formylglycine-generating enzyme required for sulfatase activity